MGMQSEIGSNRVPWDRSKRVAVQDAVDGRSCADQLLDEIGRGASVQSFNQTKHVVHEECVMIFERCRDRALKLHANFIGISTSLDPRHVATKFEF